MFGYVTATMEGEITDRVSRNRFRTLKHTVLPNFFFTAKLLRDFYMFTAVLLQMNHPVALQTVSGQVYKLIFN
jgi:hypothetical protein